MSCLRTITLVCSSALILALAGCRPDSVRPRSLQDVLKDYDYAELVPPSKLVPPGTVISIRKQTPVSVDVVCTQQSDLGNDPGVVPSESVAQELRKKTTGTFSISGDYLSQVKGNATFKSIRDIRFSLTNVRVEDLPDAAVFEKVDNRKPSCQAAIDARRSRGQPISMINSAFIGDITYTVEFEDSASLSAEAKQEILKGVSAELGLSSGTTGTNTITGAGLIWGIRDNSALVDAKKFGLATEIPKKPVLKGTARVTVSNESAPQE